MTVLTTPVGRLVAGSVYNANTTDWQGAPLVTKTGPNAGQPRSEYFFAVAIPKGTEQHWSQTPWGQIIYTAAVGGFPNGEPQRPDFAWKITDGDSQVPNKSGKIPAQKEGYAGHWVIGFSSAYAPGIVNADGTQQIVEPDAIKTGYYVQVAGSCEPNRNPGNPGVYMNHKFVALVGYGEEIHSGPDASTMGFGGQALPPGASATPLAGGFNPQQPNPAGVPAPQQMPAPASSPAQVAPYAQPTAQPQAQYVPPVAPQPAPIAAPAAAAQYAPPAGVVPGAPVAAPVAGNYMTGQPQ